MQFLHDLSFWTLWGALGLAVFFAVERLIFYFMVQRDFSALHRWVAQQGNGQNRGKEQSVQPIPVKDQGLAGRLVASAQKEISQAPTRELMEDASESAFIRANRALNQHLWVFDTIITAAPLLGLLGTILGIFDTFTALAKSGVSDPQSVSSGIGTALLATALGITVALSALLIYNFFLHRVEHLVDEVKLVLLELAGQKMELTR